MLPGVESLLLVDDRSMSASLQAQVAAALDAQGVVVPRVVRLSTSALLVGQRYPEVHSLDAAAWQTLVREAAELHYQFGATAADVTCSVFALPRQGESLDVCAARAAQLLQSRPIFTSAPGQVGAAAPICVETLPGLSSPDGGAGGLFDPDGWYRMTTLFQGPERSLDVYTRDDEQPTSRLLLRDTGDFTGQHWRFTLRPDGAYRITNMHREGLALDVLEDRPDLPVLAAASDALTQAWEITPLDEGDYRIINRSRPGDSLDIENDEHDSKPTLAATGDFDGQHWRLTPIVDACVWRTSDIIDPRIDIGAQKSLMRKMSRGEPTSLDASAMIGAIKDETLAGILLPSRRPVSERAQRLGRTAADLIPPGQRSTCVREPEGEAPLIVYRGGNADHVDAALSEAWSECGLPTPEPACDYIVDRRPPPPPPPPPGDSVVEEEGEGTLEVYVFWADLEGRPPAGSANVSLSGTSDAGGFSTDAQGVVRISGLAAGQYGVHALAGTDGGGTVSGSSSGRVRDGGTTRVEVALTNQTTQTASWSTQVLHPTPIFSTGRVCAEAFGMPGTMQLCLDAVEGDREADQARIRSFTMGRLPAAIAAEKARIIEREMQNPSVLRVEFLEEQTSFAWEVDEYSQTVETEGPQTGAVGSITLAWALQGRAMASGTYQLVLRR